MTNATTTGLSSKPAPSQMSAELRSALMDGDRKKAMELVSSGVDVHAANGLGQQASHLAASLGFIDIIEELAKRGADLSAQDQSGYTPASYAVFTGKFEAFDALLKWAPVSVWVRSVKGNSLAHLICDEASSFDEGDLGRFFSRLAQEGPAALDLINSDGDSPGHLAAREGSLGLLRALAHSGASFSLRNGCGSTASDVALLYENMEWAQFMDAHVEKQAIDATTAVSSTSRSRSKSL